MGTEANYALKNKEDINNKIKEKNRKLKKGNNSILPIPKDISEVSHHQKKHSSSIQSRTNTNFDEEKTENKMLAEKLGKCLTKLRIEGQFPLELSEKDLVSLIAGVKNSGTRSSGSRILLSTKQHKDIIDNAIAQAISVYIPEKILKSEGKRIKGREQIKLTSYTNSCQTSISNKEKKYNTRSCITSSCDNIQKGVSNEPRRKSKRHDKSIISSGQDYGAGNLDMITLTKKLRSTLKKQDCANNTIHDCRRFINSAIISLQNN